ncbi:MAG: glycosyltransferase [Desulfovibrionaceae bacterium]|nr:glycosyltransferase [Desulfovibrionaceae bacterium]
MPTPVLNITMPVFNRYELTQAALLALRKCSQDIPFTVTVVDNGSDADLVKKLIEFKEGGVIDKLFLLEKNMGISCAANIGWEMTDAPVYMKLDNDIVIKDRNFFSKIFKLWSHGDPFSTLGGAARQMLLHNPGALHTQDGVLGLCASTLAGQAIFIPKQVSDILGFWSEDYGLYGAEDGDYGLRMNFVGFKQYYYCSDNLLIDLGSDLASTYTARGFDKLTEQKLALTDSKGDFGLFMVNQALYNLCIRTWKPVRKYIVADVSSKYEVRLEENEAFADYKALLDLCAQKINERVKELGAPNPDYIFSHDFILELKDIMNSGGYGCGE